VKILKNHFIAVLSTLYFVSVTSSFASEEIKSVQTKSQKSNEEQPKLELGLGVGGLSVPHYRGSDQTAEFLIPFPYVKYTSKRLKIDREGGRYFIHDFGNSKLDISVDFAFPVKSDDNRARNGMPNLNAIIEIGPRLLFYPYTSDDESFQIRIGLPLRAAVATRIVETEFIGGTFSPYIQFRHYGYNTTIFSIGPFWATEQYHDYFYQVDPEFVTAQRSLYDAKGGYGGTKLSLASSKRFKKYWAGVFARYYLLEGAVYQDSPLIKQSTSFVIGFGIAYIFGS